MIPLKPAVVRVPAQHPIRLVVIDLDRRDPELLLRAAEVELRSNDRLLWGDVRRTSGHKPRRHGQRIIRIDTILEQAGVGRPRRPVRGFLPISGGRNRQRRGFLVTPCGDIQNRRFGDCRRLDGSPARSLCHRDGGGRVCLQHGSTPRALEVVAESVEKLAVLLLEDRPIAVAVVGMANDRLDEALAEGDVSTLGARSKPIYQRHGLSDLTERASGAARRRL